MEGVGQVDNCKMGGIYFNLPQLVDVWLFRLSMWMHELPTLEKRTGDVSIRMNVKVITQKLKINHHSSLDVMVCPFSEGIWI
jgi:hypothetical protein